MGETNWDNRPALPSEPNLGPNPITPSIGAGRIFLSVRLERRMPNQNSHRAISAAEAMRIAVHVAAERMGVVRSRLDETDAELTARTREKVQSFWTKPEAEAGEVAMNTESVGGLFYDEAFTVRWMYKIDGIHRERIIEADQIHVAYDNRTPGQRSATLLGIYTVPSSGLVVIGDPSDGAKSMALGFGKVYVMNRGGSTVATYTLADLNDKKELDTKKEAEQPALKTVRELAEDAGAPPRERRLDTW